MSLHVLLNLLNEFWEKIRYEAVLNILSIFSKVFNKFDDTGVQMQNSVYHKTIKLH